MLDPTELNDPAPLKSNCLNEAIDQLKADNPNIDWSEVEHYLEADRVDRITKIQSCIFLLEGTAHSELCRLVANKLRNYLKNL